MKKLLFQLIIICTFVFGFNACIRIDNDFDNPLSNLVYGSRYIFSDAGFLDNYYLAAGVNGKIYRSTNPLSDPWLEQISGTTNNINFLADSELFDTSVTYGVGDIGTIIRSQNQGLSWTVLNSGVTEKLNGIEIISFDLNNVIAVGNSGLILRSTNGGQNWFTVSSGVTKNLNSIYSLSSFFSFIAGDDGTLLRSSNGGMNWENRSLADTVNDLNKIGTMGSWFFGDILGMVGDSGKLYRSTDHLSWIPIETGTTEDLYEVKFKNANSGYVAGDNGTIRYTIDGGNEWFSDFFLSSLTDERINSTLIINDTMAVGVAGNKIILVHANESLLPVELSSFNYSIQHNDVHLNWTTSSEVNNSGFEIERSSAKGGVKGQASGDWMKIGFVNGNGTISTPSNYEFSDRSLKPGKYNYRLKQIDYNGNYEYFNLSGEVIINAPEKFSLSQNYPNPFNPSTKIKFSISTSGFTSLKVYDISGKEISNLLSSNIDAGIHEVIFDASNFSSGTYFYRLESDGFVETKKMLIFK